MIWIVFYDCDFLLQCAGQKRPDMIPIIALFKMQEILFYTVKHPTIKVLIDLRRNLRTIVVKVFNTTTDGFHYSPVNSLTKYMAHDIVNLMIIVFRAINGSTFPQFNLDLHQSIREIILLLDCLICNPQTANGGDTHEQMWILNELAEEAETKLWHP